MYPHAPTKIPSATTVTIIEIQKHKGASDRRHVTASLRAKRPCAQSASNRARHQNRQA